MFIQRAFKLLFVLCCFFQSDIATPQVGPNDFDVDEALRIMKIESGMVIGEAGAGRGFFTFALADRVGPEGKIYANDIKGSALEYIRNRCDREAIENITTILGEITDPLFPARNLEMVVIVHAFHDFDQPEPWLKNLRKYMKEGAVLAILDRDPDRWGRMHYHFLTREEMVTLLRDAGFKNIEVDTSLKNDNIYLARK